MAGKKIAILGGSFNPVHYGHINLAKNVVAEGVADEVWLSLSPKNPFKDKSMLMPAPQRLKLMNDAVQGIPGVKVTDIELSLPEPSYTIDAFDKLTQLYPDNNFVLLIGSDNLEGFIKWKDWEKILERHGLIVYPRDTTSLEIPESLKKFSNRIILLTDMPQYAISSTEIRSANKCSI